MQLLLGYIAAGDVDERPRVDPTFGYLGARAYPQDKPQWGSTTEAFGSQNMRTEPPSYDASVS